MGCLHIVRINNHLWIPALKTLRLGRLLKPVCNESDDTHFALSLKSIVVQGVVVDRASPEMLLPLS